MNTCTQGKECHVKPQTQQSRVLKTNGHHEKIGRGKEMFYPESKGAWSPLISDF